MSLAFSHHPTPAPTTSSKSISQTLRTHSSNSPFPVKKSISESREFLLKILPNEENPDIEKFAMMLIPENCEASQKEGEGDGNEEEGKTEMVGFVGTNRYKESGMEVGYVINRRFWGRGFATEGLRMFLDMYWEMSGLFPLLSFLCQLLYI